MKKRIKCQAETCEEWAWCAVPTLFGDGYLCKKHADLYKAAQIEKWQKELKKL